MAHSYHHAVSSARKFGGIPADYQAVHDWLDGSKQILADFRHRALRHHAEGCFAAEALFGRTITNSDGREVPVRLVAEQHILEERRGAGTGLRGFDPRSRPWHTPASCACLPGVAKHIANIATSA
jgi:hypothetical protein